MAIITISRLVGSLGEEIAQALAQKLGCRLIGHQDFQRPPWPMNPTWPPTWSASWPRRGRGSSSASSLPTRPITASIRPWCWSWRPRAR